VTEKFCERCGADLALPDQRWCAACVTKIMEAESARADRLLDEADAPPETDDETGRLRRARGALMSLSKAHAALVEREHASSATIDHARFMASGWKRCAVRWEKCATEYADGDADITLLAGMGEMLTVIQCIAEQGSRIFVREEVDGKWGSYALTEMPTELAIMHVLRFVSEGRMPVVVGG